MRRLPGALLAIPLFAAGVFWLGFDGGTYSLESRSVLAICIWWALAAIVLVARPVLSRAAAAVSAVLAGLAALTLASIVWSASAERAFNEFNRVMLYLGLFVLFAVIAPRLGRRWLLDGVALGASAIATVALASRFAPDLVEEGEIESALAAARLSYPVDYWNGLAVLVAFGVPLLLAAATRPRPALLRGLALVPLPAIGSVIYLASSRGGVATAVLGALTFLALTARRWAAASALLVAGAGTALALISLRSREVLVEGPLDSAAAAAAGEDVALVIAATCFGTGALYALGCAVRIPTPQLRRGLRVALALTLAMGATAGVVALDPVERARDFRRFPAGTDSSIEGHLLSTSGNVRWQLWETAAEQGAAHSLLGDGAGSFEAWWAEHRPVASVAIDAHSLYLESFGELGPVGLGLLLAFVLLVLALGGLRLRSSLGDERITLAAALASFAAYAFEAAFDWMWELTAVSVVGVLAAAVVAATPGRTTRAEDPRAVLAARALAIAAAVVVIACQVVPLAARTAVEESQAAVRRGNVGAALEHAQRARAVQPWAATPYVQLALVQEAGGNAPAAAATVQRALDRDPSDWRLWLLATRIQTKAGSIAAARRSLARARKLNPLSPLFARA